MKIQTFLTMLLACNLAASAQRQNAPANTKLYYPRFTLTIQGFQGFDGWEAGNDRTWIFTGDTLQAALKYNTNQNIIGHIVKADTLKLYEFVGEYIPGKLIRITPKNKSDSFAISYAYEQSTYDVIDYRDITPEEREEKEKSRIEWIDVTAYRPIKSVQRNVFKVPEHTDNGYTRVLKKKYHLHDTLVVIPSEYDIAACFTDKNQRLYGYWLNYIYLRIDRFVKGKWVERKLIKVWFSDSC